MSERTNLTTGSKIGGRSADEITREDIVARLRALPADDPLRAPAHRINALLDQLEARRLELMQDPVTFEKGEALAAGMMISRSVAVA
jgi:hypothetical protein